MGLFDDVLPPADGPRQDVGASGLFSDVLSAPAPEPEPEHGKIEDAWVGLKHTATNVLGAWDKGAAALSGKMPDWMPGKMSQPEQAMYDDRGNFMLDRAAEPANTPNRWTGQVSSAASYALGGSAAPVLMGLTGGTAAKREYSKQNVDDDTSDRIAYATGAIDTASGMIPFGKYLFGQGVGTLAKSVVGSSAKAAVGGAVSTLANDASDASLLNVGGYDALADKTAPSFSPEYLNKLKDSAEFMAGFHGGMQVGGRMMSRQPLVGLAPQHLVGEETGGAAPHDPSSEQATIDLTPPAPLEMEHTAINPYDVGGHVSELQQNRPMTVDNAQADLFGGANDAPPPAETAPVQPKPEDLVTPQQRAETFAKYQGVPVVHGTTETGTRFGGKVYNHAPGADPLSNEKLTAEVNKTAAAEAAYPEDRTTLEHAIIGAAHESGVVRPGEMKPAFVAKTIKDLNLEGATTSELAAHFVQNHLEELQGKKGKTNQEKIGFYQALLTRLPDVSNERKGVENGTDNKPKSTGSQDAQAAQQQDVGTLRQNDNQPDRQTSGPLERAANSTEVNAPREKIAALVDTLPAQQKALYSLVSDAANNRTLDSFVNADGTWQYQKIADTTGMTRQAAYKAVQDLKPKFNALFGGDVKAALAARTKAVRTNEGSDYDRLGESPAHQASVVDHAEITGGEDRPGMQGMGVIDRVNRSQSGEQDVPASKTDLARPDPVYEKRVAENKARMEAQQDAVLKQPEAEEAMTDWNDMRTDGAVEAEALSKQDAYDWVLTYVEFKNGDITEAKLNAEQRDIERRYEGRANEKISGEPGGRAPESARVGQADAREPTDKQTASERANPIEQRVAELRDRLSGEPVLAKRLDKFIQRYRDGDWDLNRFKDELDTLEQAPRGAKAEPVDRRDPAAEERRQRYLEMTPEELRLEIAARDRRERTSYLTGLDNRVAYDESPKMKVTASADIDGMKAVNDHLGHAAGDSLIKAKADALKWAAKSEPGVRIYHQSGDEFIAQANSHAEIDRVMNAARDKLMSEGFKYTAPDGSVQTKKGVGFSYGKGDTYEIADRNLHDDKAARKAAGLRTGERDTPAPGDRGKTARVGSREGAQDAGHDTRAAEDFSGRRADAEATARKVEHIANEHPAFLEETQVPAKGINASGREEDIKTSAHEAVSALKDDVSYLKKFLDCVK